MNTKTKHSWIIKLLSVGVLLVFISVIQSPQVAEAQTTKPDGARVTQNQACGDYRGDQKSACEEGYNAPLGDRKVLSPQRDYSGREEADAQDACGRFNYAPNHNACKKGYKEGHHAYYHKSSTDPVAKAEKVEAALKAQKEGERYRCGNEASGSSVETKFNFGCLGNEGPENMGAIEDVLYSIIRFLTAGIGIVLVIAIILAAIQYSASQGNSEATQAAKSKIQNIIIGLFIYLFAFAIIQFLVPGGLFT